MATERARPGTERILGVDFFAGPLDEAVAAAWAGGLVVAPSAPGLAHDLPGAPAYRAALEAAEVVLTDSSFLLLLWRLRGGRRLPRHSGLAFLRALLAGAAARAPGAIFWVMPSEAERDRNLAWLATEGVPTKAEECYVAPHYGAGELADAELLARVRARAPRVVVLAIGGGVQERLGHFLRRELGGRAGVVCTGAALAFLSGAQVGIPPWVDRARLGWLWRVGSAPRAFGPRYLRAWRLATLVWRHGAGSVAR